MHPVIKGTLVSLGLVLSQAAWGQSLGGKEQTAPNSPSLLLPQGDVPVPAGIIQGLLIYLADRPGIAGQLLAGLNAAGTTAPKECPKGGGNK